MRKIRYLILALLIAAVLLPGAVFAQQKTIGFALWTMEYTFFQAVEKGVRDSLQGPGLQVHHAGPELPTPQRWCRTSTPWSGRRSPAS